MRQWILSALGYVFLTTAALAQVGGLSFPGPGPRVAATGGPIAIIDNPCAGTGDVISGVQNSPATSDPATFTSGYTAGLVLVYFSQISGAITAPALTWSGGGGAWSVIGSTSNVNVSMVAMGSIAPGAASGGTFTVSWTGGATARILLCAITLSNTKTASVAAAFPNATSTNSGTVTAPSISVTTVAGDFPIGWFSDSNGVSFGCSPNQTTLFVNNGGLPNCANDTTAVGTTTTLSATLTNSTATPVLGFDIAKGP